MQLINHCTNAPYGLERKVRLSLRLIEPTHLVGLASIHLEDAMPKSGDAESEEEWVKRVRGEGLTDHVGGWYVSSAEGNPAFIMLYVRPIYRSIPRPLRWSTAPTLRIVRTLAHEVAHHLIATRGYVFDEGEDVADEELLAERYAEQVLLRATKRWLYKLGELSLNEIASWQYTRGILDWRDGRYLSAAERFYDAWNLNPKIKDAAYWYWRSRDKLVQTQVE